MAKRTKKTSLGNITISDSLEETLEQLPAAVRGTVVKSALRAGARPVISRAKQLVPKPGYRGDKAGKKPLRDTITVVFRAYKQGSLQFAAVGPAYPAGAHGHLVEEGHEIVLKDGTRTGKRTREKEFMAPAVDQTMKQQLDAMDAKLLQAIKKHGG